MEVWQYNKDISVSVSTQEILPPNLNVPKLQDFIVTMYIGNEQKVDTIHSEETIHFYHIPGRFRKRQVRLKVAHADFTPQFYEIDTMVSIKDEIVIPIVRDTNQYGHISLHLIEEKSLKPLQSENVVINQDTIMTDEEGNIVHYIEYRQQAEKYILQMPQYDKVDTIYMPSQEGGIVLI